MEDNKFWLRIALNAPEMEIRIPKEENEMLRSNTVSMKKKRAIIARAMNGVFKFGDNAEVEIFYDDMDVCVSMNDYIQVCSTQVCNNDEIEKENSKMENKNQMDIIANKILGIANDFNERLADEMCKNEEERDKDLCYIDGILCSVMGLVNSLGYECQFEDHECGNEYCWNEFISFDIINKETGEIKTYQCTSYFMKTYKAMITIYADAHSMQEAKEKVCEELHAMTADCHFDIREEN